MIEVNFKDRVPTHPGRIKLTPVQGQENTFDMVRADEPIEIGTPLNKATFESIIQSRLTGRYYVSTVTRTILTSQTGLTVNPIPTNAWVQTSSVMGWTGSWTIETSSTDGSSYPWNVLDGNTATSWMSTSGTSHFWKISSGNSIALKKFKVQFSGSMAAELQGSNDGITWKHITHLSNPGELAEYSIVTPVSYNYIRVLFTSSVAGRAGLNEFVITEYDIATAQNEFVIDAFPITITDHQRFTIITQPTVNTIGVTRNTLNGRNIDIILQPNKRYELVSSWDGNFYAREW